MLKKSVEFMKKILLPVCFAFFLASCDTAEERAEGHYQDAVELIADGDSLRGLVELRNVFKLNGRHREARRLYAETVLEMGEIQDAYGNYLRLVEQYPGDEDANRQLALLSAKTGNIASARAFLDIALKSTPDDLELQSIDVFEKYLATASTAQTKQREETVARANELLEQDPSLAFARQIQIDQDLRSRDWPSLLVHVDEGLKQDPTNLNMFRAKLTALEALAMEPEIEATLVQMTQRFPTNIGIGRALLNWFTSRNELDKAEAWLRTKIDPDGQTPTARLDLINFLQHTRGEDVALQELTDMESQIPQPLDFKENYGLFTSIRTGLMFNLGQGEAAIVRLEDLIESADQDEEELDRMKVALAQMYEQTDNPVGARALVDEVLQRDRSQVGALKIQARWHIQDDKPEDAIANLREALDQAPEDSSILTLLADAYERQGNRELMLDVMSRAVETSGRGPNESIILASALEQNGEFRTAETVLVESLRINSFNLSLIEALALLHMEISDWGRVDQSINRLRAIHSIASNTIADKLETQKLLRQRKTDDLLSFVEDQISNDSNGEAGVVRALVLTGRTEEAFERARKFYEEKPESPLSRFIYAATLTYVERDAEALPIFEGLIEETPSMLFAWSSIYQIHFRAEDMAAASETLNRAAAAMPGNMNVQWLQAGHAERVGEIEEAISIYESIYAENSSIPVIANNLASLIASTRSDEESLERAYLVARRLRGSEVPEFADTYGWIAFRRGDMDEALSHLERAAEALPNEASVHYHLGATYAANGQGDLAVESLERAELLVSQGGHSYPGLDQDIIGALTPYRSSGTVENDG